MELGLTFPLQRFLGIRTPAWGTEPDRRFCWDLHVIRLRGRGCLLAVHCHSRYAFVRWDVPPLQREDIPGLFRAGLTDSLTAAGLSPARVEGYLERNLKPWDFAAGALLVREAGGRVGDFGGCAPDFSKNCDLIAAGPELWDELLCLAAEE